MSLGFRGPLRTRLELTNVCWSRRVVVALVYHVYSVTAPAHTTTPARVVMSTRVVPSACVRMSTRDMTHAYVCTSKSSRQLKPYVVTPPGVITPARLIT